MAEPLYSTVEALQKSPPKEIIVVITAVTIGICCALSWYRRKYIDTHEKHCQVRSFWHPFEACRGPSEHYINYTLFELLSILSQVLQCFTTVCLPGSTVIQTHNGQGVLEDLLAAFKKRDSQWLLSGIPCVNGVWDFCIVLVFTGSKSLCNKMRTKTKECPILWCIHKNVLNIVTSNIPCFLYWHPWFVPSFGLQMLVFPVVPLRLGGRSVPPFSWGWRCKRRWRKRIAKAAGHRLP